MDFNQPNVPRFDSGDDERQQRRLRDNAALVEYLQLNRKWAAMNAKLEAAFRDPSTLSLRQSMNQLVRELNYVKVMHADSTGFIGRLLGTGNPFATDGGAEGGEDQV